MADRIRLLPDVVANQIAAGEVVGRPSSVVKEMMENAVDAGAATVTVNFRDGGRDLIQIVDDGCGMSPVDARLAFDRHATSKIGSVDDIYALHTFGFRGEALASIAAVAQVELRTRQAEDELGTSTEIHGGQFIAQTTIACPVGSQFFVRNIFYNVPARRRFLDKSTASATQIKTEFRRVALCYPQIAFELYSNDQPLYRLRPSTLAGRIVDTVGRHMKQNLLEVDAKTSIVHVHGYVGRPEAARKSGADQYLFVNGRYFRSPGFYKAILKAYEKLVPEGSAPSYFLYLDIDPERIDVNVHPQKTEVKFADEDAVWQIIHAAVREALAKTGAVPMMDFDDQASVEIPVLDKRAVYREPRSLSRPDYNPFAEDYLRGGNSMSVAEPLLEQGRDGAFDRAWENFVSDGLRQQSETEPETEFEFIPSTSETVQQRLGLDEREEFSHVTLLGSGYAVALLGGRLMAIDLRRLRERLLYDAYLAMLGNGSAVSQQLLFPERLTLSADHYALLEEHAVEFAALGFDMDFAGENTVEVKGTPADVPPQGVDTLLYELIETLSLPLDAAEQRRERIAAALARSGSGQSARNLAADQVADMLDQLSAGGNIAYTPSGKAILAEITPEELRSKLG